MFGTKIVEIERVVEKTVRVKDPLNVQVFALYTQLLTEHRQLLETHRALINTLRKTPVYPAAASAPLYLTEEEEDAQVTNAGLRLAPAPNPFEDLREDEEMLRGLGLSNEIEFH